MDGSEKKAKKRNFSFVFFLGDFCVLMAVAAAQTHFHYQLKKLTMSCRDEKKLYRKLKLPALN